MAKAIPQIIDIVKIDGCEMVIKLDEKLLLVEVNMKTSEKNS